MPIPAPLAIAALLLGLTAGPGAVVDPAGSRSAQPGTAVRCTARIPAGQRIPELPWAQRRLAPERVAPLATGAGVIVAVIDSGVDTRHPQLVGRVLPGRDFLAPGHPGTQDCVGHGTAVASIIAGGQPPPGIAFRGLAPDARILPVRVSEKQTSDGRSTGAAIGPERLGQAIRWAVREGHARVLNISLILAEDHPAVRSAIDFAIARDVVVVAAAGNFFGAGNPRPYPASYAGVIGVGAVASDGTREQFSQVGPYVDLMAPGGDVTVAVPGGGYAIQRGTSYAAPFVAATAALVRQYWPDLPAAEVSRRLLATTDPSAGGRRSDGYGTGVVNPHRALTEVLSVGLPVRAGAVAEEVADPAAVAAARRGHGSRQRALALAGIGIVLVSAMWLLGVVLPRGGRRGWQPGDSDNGPRRRPGTP